VASATLRPPCAGFQADLAPAGGVRAASPALVLASGMNQPDDILVDADGATYVGELATGRIVQLGGRRAPQPGLFRLPVTVPRVEGLARIGDLFFAADQANDRIVSFRAGDSVPQTFFQLAPVRGLEGVDGIAATADTLLVPDSPRGTLLFIGLDGAVKRTVGGFARPTGAWPLPDGSVLVADENAGTVVKVAPDGSKRVLVGGLPLVDDVVADQQGAVFAISITRANLVEVADGTAREVAGGFAEPQGLAVDGAGNLLVTEFTAGRLDLVLRSFRILPAATVPVLQAGQGLCLRLIRAPGFAEPLMIESSGAYTVLNQVGGEAAGEVLPERCSSPPCLLPIQVRAGIRVDTVIAAYS
jgi:sugar lactone lactonase YvrE